MATIEQCRKALQEIATRLSADPEVSKRGNLNRSLACHIRDMDAYFHGRLQHGSVVGLADGDDPKAEVRLSVSGDDLLALVSGELNFPAAWATGRVSVKASFGDLLKLRKLL